MNLHTYLPLFTGFYQSSFDSDNAEEMAIEDYNEDNDTNLSWEDFNFNNKEYYQRVAKEITRKVCEKVNEVLNAKLNFKFEELISPREYNFSNDSINIEIEGDLKPLEDYINNNLNAFDTFIKEKFSNYDGFSSFYSNDVHVWLSDEYKNKSVYLGTLLDFILKNEEIEEISLELEETNYIEYSLK